ncbi:MAG TPA: hypothetical protein VJY62_02730, partial [Bacteroidia bacterium]|nr:hypothetical protein [Bacteroidia bacterium]
ESGEDDPCDARKSSFKFKPGEDPYSFIATIALPAWTPRFSNKEYVRIIENKKVFDRSAVETLIYREAPAHILLRILWLTPHDMCCFEEKFKKWNLWLSQKSPLCIDPHSNCEFIEYLFTTKFECTDELDCTECVPCPDKTTVSVPCFNDAKEECGNFNLRKKINDLYCWEQCSAIEEELVFCDETDDQVEGGALQKTRKLKPETEKPKKEIQKPVEEKLMKSKEAGIAEKEIKPPEREIIADPRALMKFYRRRQSNWLDDFSKIIPVKNGDDPLIQNSVMYPVRSKALAILKNPNPGTDWFINEVEGILNEKAKTKGAKEKLTAANKNSIVEIVLCSLFDRICSGDAKEMDVKKLASFINANKKQINSKKVFKRWRYDDYSENKIDADIEKLKSILPLDNS